MVERFLPRIAWYTRADVMPTSTQKSGQHRHYNGNPTSIVRRPNISSTSTQHWADVGPTFSQYWGDIGPTYGRRWANVFCQQCANILVNFSPTFCQPFTILWLLIFTYNLPQIKHNFWGLKDVQKLSYFKAFVGTCLEAWHSHNILQTSGYYVCYKSDFVCHFLLPTYLYT